MNFAQIRQVPFEKKKEEAQTILSAFAYDSAE